MSPVIGVLPGIVFAENALQPGVMGEEASTAVTAPEGDAVHGQVGEGVGEGAEGAGGGWILGDWR